LIGIPDPPPIRVTGCRRIQVVHCIAVLPLALDGRSLHLQFGLQVRLVPRHWRLLTLQWLDPLEDLLELVIIDIIAPRVLCIVVATL
jgi:hypothetical protein